MRHAQVRTLVGAVAIGAMMIFAGCGSSGDDGSNGGNGGDSPSGKQSSGGPQSQQCELPNNLTRRNDVPIGVLMPAGSLQRQSYTSGAEVAAAGLNAVSLGFEFYFIPAGDIVFDFDGNADDNAKERWKNSLRCSVIDAKQAGLVVAVWGQFVEAGRRGEPGEVAPAVQTKVLDGALALMPEVGMLLEELQVEYWAPVSELERFAGVANHNTYFPRFVDAGRPHFTGTMYVQPNILQSDGFVVQNIEPNLGGVDALGISWISYECEDDKLPPGISLASADFYVDAAAAQGITRVYISELGGTQATDASARPCLETLIDNWNGVENGVFLLDMPTDFPNGATINGSWQEEVLQVLRG